MMSSTICATRDFTTLPRDHYTRNASSAALPLLPRRTSGSAPTSRRNSPVGSPDIDSSVLSYRALNPAAVIVEPPTPVDTKTVASGSFQLDPTPTAEGSDSPNYASRPKRVRGRRFPAMHAPERSTPIPSRSTFVADSDSDSDTPRPARVVRSQHHVREPASSRLGHRVGADGDTVRHQSESHVHTLSRQARLDEQHTPRRNAISIASSNSVSGEVQNLLRKKSGEPLKSSLKAKRSNGTRGSLSIVTSGAGASMCKSEPATPSLSKNVHFDAQLEHVKVYFAEQKPLAVSRDGSPTDTSGTDTDFPSFIYGAKEEEAVRGALVMRKVDVPVRPNLNADIALETLELLSESSSVQGVVRVKNLAFEKWVAVRFTMDWWQTTSEVTARYVGSCEDGVDRFGFTIKLHDMLARAEEKTLFLALRYTVAGREIWDNNGGKNYHVKFTREKVPAKQDEKKDVPTSSAPSSSPQKQSTEGNEEFKALHSKLEQLEEKQSVGGFLVSQKQARSQRSPTKPPSFKSENSLSSRYNFGDSLRNSTWRAPPSPSPSSGSHHQRTSTYPTTSPKSKTSCLRRLSPPPPSSRTTTPTQMPIQSQPFRGQPGFKLSSYGFGSPREELDGPLPFTYYSTATESEDTDEGIMLVPSVKRKHQRGGCFEADANVKRTPPTSPPTDFKSTSFLSSSLSPTSTPTVCSPTPVPRSAPVFPRVHSFPPALDTASPRSPYNSTALLSPHWATASLGGGGSEESTPSITSASTSRSTSPSLDEIELATIGRAQGRQTQAQIQRETSRESPVHLFNNYTELLNRFCFFTGSPGSGSRSEIPSNYVSRSHSVSSLEELLSSQSQFQTPPLGFAFSPYATPVHSPASDGSGSTTPTAGAFRHLPQTPPMAA
ncbi:hypothetical protein EW146_g1240 [Bondarzewia mesenterica]|uniref:CBM21 domain-containing protein n=1 Tax=Bondarzewia mesenterica TaxID=1095465 RepID=A0A4S4M4J8_9AGAM|nr:hypothetical protein EW146_g1240 [Bondarzewia mesenterica]